LDVQVAFDTETLTTINSYGYSPHPLADYLTWVENIITTHRTSTKPVIISITASGSQALASMVEAIQELRAKLLDKLSRPSILDNQSARSKIGIELNTSCPNIPGSPPSGYSFNSILPLLRVLAEAHAIDSSLTIGLKLPPYVYKDQFAEVISVLQSFDTAEYHLTDYPFSFLTCTNTLGNSLLFSDQTTEDTNQRFAVPTGLGGLAGEALHPLALGNVYTFKQLISSQIPKYSAVKNIKIIGVGGVTSKAGAERMKKAGADVVGCATLFGKEGVRAFEILGKE